MLGTLKWRQIFTLRLNLSLLFNSEKKNLWKLLVYLNYRGLLYMRVISSATYLFSLPHISAFCYKCRVPESPLQLPSMLPQMVAFWSTEGLGKNNIFTLHMTALTCIVQLFKQHKERGCFSWQATSHVYCVYLHIFLNMFWVWSYAGAPFWQRCKYFAYCLQISS